MTLIVPGAPTRRGLLLGAGAATGVLAAPGLLRAAPSSIDPFTLGVASGDPLPDGFVLWTRLAPDPLAKDGLGGMSSAVTVDWEVARDPAMRQTAAKGRAVADAGFVHSVHVEVGGLQPDRPYWYRFTAMGAQSPVGRARTAPRPGARMDRLKVVACSCAHYELGWFSAYRHMAAEEPDLAFFLGDYIYEYSYRGDRGRENVRLHERDEDVVDLAGFRVRYAQYKTDPDLQALHAVAPSVVTWDDHEVQNDYSGAWSQDVSISQTQMLARRAAGYRAFYEHMPLRRHHRPNGPDMRIYRRMGFGDLADITVLDGRQYRSIQACASPTSRRGHVAKDAECANRTDPTRTMLGAAQEDWLYKGFKRGGARWTVIAQDLLVAPALEHAPGGGFGYFTDSWDGYAANRDRMLAALAGSKARNPVFFGGDAHCFFNTDLKADFADPAARTIATEFVTTAVTQNPPAGSPYAGVMARSPHIKFFDETTRGYIGFEIGRDRMETRFQAISDRADPKATVRTLQRFVVEDGKPGAVAV